MRLLGTAAVVLAVGILASSVSGCAYMTRRGDDALATFDIGFTLSLKPHFSAYVGALSLLGVGYSEFDGKFLGLGNQHAGWMDSRYHAGGLLLEAYEQWGFDGDYNMDLPNSPPARGAGVGLLYHELPDTVVGAAEVPIFVHAGWIGFNLNCKVGQIVNFIVGWTTLDLAHNEEHLHPAVPPSPAPASKS